MQVAQPYFYTAPKSVGLAFALTFFLGPLGLFYSSVTGGIVMLVVSILLAFTTAGISILFTWPVCIIWGCLAASNYNASLAAQAPVQIMRP